MFKYIKLYAQYKDARKQIKADYGTGKAVGVVTSRKSVGAVLMLAGHFARQVLGVDIDQVTLDSLTDASIVLATYAVEIHGIIMQAVSYVSNLITLVKKIIALFKAQKEAQ